jgi:hypothetical protein
MRSKSQAPDTGAIIHGVVNTLLPSGAGICMATEFPCTAHKLRVRIDE